MTRRPAWSHWGTCWTRKAPKLGGMARGTDLEQGSPVPTRSDDGGAKTGSKPVPAGSAAGTRSSPNGRVAPYGRGQPSGVLPGDHRSADDVEAGIVALWKEYGQHRRQRLRDRLVLHYAPLVKYVAGRVGTGLPAHVDV